jgi:hypothetical protein
LNTYQAEADKLAEHAHVKSISKQARLLLRGARGSA